MKFNKALHIGTIVATGFCLLLSSGWLAPVSRGAEPAAPADKWAVQEFKGVDLSGAAVTEFTAQLRKELSGLGIKVIDDKDMKKALEQSKEKIAVPCAEAPCAQQLAKVYDVAKIVVGSVSSKGADIALKALVVGAADGKVVQQCDETITGTKEQFEKETQKIAYKIAKKLTEPPSQVSSSSIKPGQPGTGTTPSQPKSTTGGAGATAGSGADTSSAKPQTATRPTTPSEPKKDAPATVPPKTGDAPKTGDTK